MGEEAARVRNEAIEKATEAEIDQAGMGQALAFLLTLVAFISAIVFFAVGNTVAGVAFLSVPVIMLIRAFLPSSGGSQPD